MIKAPDIEDIGDVSRFSERCYYPYRRTTEGDADGVVYIRAAGPPNTVIVSIYKEGETRQDKDITLESFLKLEQGYYKSRLVEYNGSVVYIQNNGGNEYPNNNHAFRTDRVDYFHLHPEVTSTLLNIDGWKQALIALSNRKTKVYAAIDKLEKGEVIGCALSDNYGLITNSKSANIQIIRRNRIIGEVRNGSPYLNDGMEHFHYAVNKLWH